jgi:hypothetical protein
MNKNEKNKAEIFYISVFDRKLQFTNSFVFFWAIFARLNQDPDTDCESGYGSGTSLNPDPIRSRIRIHNT